MGEVLLSIRNLKIYYYTLSGIVRAVDGVDLDVYSGEWITIVGESGSGKSTLAMSVLGLILPPGRVVEGSILFDGVDIAKAGIEELRRIRGRRIGVIFQDPGAYLDPLRTVGSQIAEAVIEHRLASSWDEAWVKAEEALELVGVPASRARSYPHQLSGGQKQRVAIAAAIALEPELLVADEPTTALDVIVQAKIMELLEDLRRKKGLTILMVTHDIALASEVSDRVAVMYAGRIVEVGGSRRIVESPSHPYTRMLVESVPDVWVKKPVRSIPGDPPDLRRPPRGCRFHPRCPLALEECRSKQPPRVPMPGGGWAECFLAGMEYGG
ncbi:MAG: ABC transporter ATP-binding protein [Desulfurococcales archaeon]|nr:ABC transporter ATP-binding protein [Desulfurococcales archaeon]